MARQYMHFPKSLFNRHYGPQLLSYTTIIDFIDYWQDHISFLIEFKIISSAAITQLAESKSVKGGLAAGLFKLYSWQVAPWPTILAKINKIIQKRPFLDSLSPETCDIFDRLASQVRRKYANYTTHQIKALDETEQYRKQFTEIKLKRQVVVKPVRRSLRREMTREFCRQVVEKK